MAKTIAAISTAQAPGGIGIVRISGDQALQIADKVFRGKGKLAEAKGYTAHFGRVFDIDGEFDEAIATVFLQPKSYTGEDVVEISCHGGLYITQKLLRAVLTAGAQPAQAGEFTRRAFMNGKMGLTSAEAVMDLIGAQGEKAAKAALAGKDGALEKKIRLLRDRLVSAAAHLSAWADFPDEDIPEVTESALAKVLEKSLQEVEALLRQFEIGRVIRQGVDTVILGRPNVGKSTLMNLLSGCEKSIVTPVAGTTRDIVEETVKLGDVLLRLADTAGLRQTEDPVESIGVKRAKERMDAAGLILAVFDASNPLTEEDKQLIGQLKDKPAIAVLNKEDLQRKINYKYINDNIKQIVYISAKEGSGLSELIESIANILGTAEWNPADGMLLTERQRSAASLALGFLEEAKDALDKKMTLDAITVSMEGAISTLLELTGERVSEAVVDGVFSQFCVGK